MNIPKISIRSRPKFDHSFDVKNLFWDFFTLSTISIAFIAWIITLAGSAVSAFDNEVYPRFTWWGNSISIRYNSCIAAILCI